MKLFNDDLMRWYVCKSKVYHNLPEEKIDSNGCYFLLDTKDVILEGYSYSGLLITYSGDKPTRPSTHRLYLNTDNCSVSVWTGTSWLLLYSTANAQLISADPNDPEYNRVVSGSVVVDYAKRLLVDSFEEYAKFYKLAYNEDTHKLEFHIGAVEGEQVISGIGNRLLLNSETNQMYLLDANANVLSSFVLYPRNVTTGKFNYETLELEFGFTTGNPISIPCGQMFNLLHTQNTCTIRTSTMDKKKLTMEVLRSQEADNQLIKLADGVFCSFLSKMDKIQPGFEGAVLGFDELGNTKILKRRIINTQINPLNEDPDSLVTEELMYNILVSPFSKYAKYSDIYTNPDAIHDMYNSLKVTKV